VFTGLVEGTAEVLALERRRAGARLTLAAPQLARGAAPWRPVTGESLAISGCCLTVCAVRRGRTSFDLSRETLERTWLGELEPGECVNLERALSLADRLGGHVVSGHVEAVGRIAAVEQTRDGGALFRFEVPHGFEPWLLAKGSIAVDGISLTIVEPRGRRFGVAVIPETLRRTTLAGARPGRPVHLEADQLARWVARLLEQSGSLRPAGAGFRRRRTGRR
jgi:riboflavin synthase